MEAAFSMYPTSIEELLAVADAGLLMPPKSTWFEPKLRSGLFIHRVGVGYADALWGGCVRERRERSPGGGGFRSGRD